MSLESSVPIPRIWVDINEWDGGTRSVPIPPVSVRALEAYGLHLHEGMALHLYSDDLDDQGRRDDLVADGVAHYDASTDRWIDVNLGRIRNVSELDDEAIIDQVYLGSA